jgi:3-methyladenine DNA glycosylase AlkD
LGIKVKSLRIKAKQIGIDHNTAMELWASKIHEARILATMIDDFNKVTKSQMNEWVKDFNSWDLCDSCCNNLFRKTPFAIDYSFAWPDSEKEFTRRAGFVMIAVLAFHNKALTDQEIINYFPLIIKHSIDDRNFVKKSVNWALRQIGKRNKLLYQEAIEVSRELSNSTYKSAKWIGKDAIRELCSDQVVKRIYS